MAAVLKPDTSYLTQDAPLIRGLRQLHLPGRKCGCFHLTQDAPLIRGLRRVHQVGLMVALKC